MKQKYKNIAEEYSQRWGLGIVKFLFFPFFLLRELTMSHETEIRRGGKFTGYKINSRKIVALIFLIVFVICCYVVLKEAVSILQFVESTTEKITKMSNQKYTVMKEFLKLYKNGTPVTNVISTSLILSLGGMVLGAYGLYTVDKIKRFNGGNDE